MMIAFPPVSIPKLSSLLRTAFRITRTQNISFPRQLAFCQAETADFGINGSLNVGSAYQSLFKAEKVESKAVLKLFLKKLESRHSSPARKVNVSDHFVEHLVLKLYSVHKTRYQVGRELSTLEIRETLTPYLESLLEEHGDFLVDMVENFPYPPQKDRPSLASPSPSSLDPKKHKPLAQVSEVKETRTTYFETPHEELGDNLVNLVEDLQNGHGKEIPSMASPRTSYSASRKLKALARVSEVGHDGKLSPRVLYLIELGMDLEQIKLMVRREPSIIYYNLEGKIKPVVKFLLDLGVNQSDIPSIISKRPQLCGIRLLENIIPMMTYLETMGVDDKQWAKVIYKCPPLLTLSREKVRANVDFLYELGLTTEVVGKMITRAPNIVTYSVKENLHPTAEYLRSMGINVADLVQRTPQVFGLSIERNLKPLTEFFLKNGYSVEEIATMVTRFGPLYTLSLTENIIPKWQFFLTLDYPKSELLSQPQYFGYSLEGRIKPRFAELRKSGVKMSLSQVLCPSKAEFEKVLKKKKMKQKSDDEAYSEVKTQ